MMSYDQQRGLAQLASTDWWRRVVRPMLEERLAEYDRQNRSTDGANVARTQGRALELAELIAMFDNARDQVVRADGQRNRPNPSLRF